jgi:prephenate dehydratase
MTFDAVLGALTGGEVEWAVLPVWNSTIGRVAAARDALDRREKLVRRVGEVDVPVHHCLLALPGTSLASVRYVGSHPAALSQCTGLFRLQPRMQAVEAFDTAGAARQLAVFDSRSTATGDRWYDALAAASPASLAAIASAKAAETYGLDILQRGVNDEPTNFTRFVVLGARGEAR